MICVRFEPVGVEVTAAAPITVMMAAARAGVALEHPCGGRGLCGKCRVRLREDDVEHSAADLELLSEEERRDYCYLSCRTELWKDARVECESGRRTTAGVVLIEGVRVPVEPSPRAGRLRVVLPPPSLEDQRDDRQRLLDAVNQAGRPVGRLRPSVLYKLPKLLRATNWQVWVYCVEDEITAIYPGLEAKKILGIAVDVGTTTVVASLIDLESGEELAAQGRANEQLVYGPDVISRITCTQTQENGTACLQKKIVETLNGMIEEMLRETGREKTEIAQVLAVGNPTMQQMLAGIDPGPIAWSPFIPATRDPLEMETLPLGLEEAPEARLSLAPIIAGYVGGDIVADILVSGIHRARRPSLLIDIGTNAEIVVGCEERLIACASPAGPAFEGGEISRGMRALPGAISSVWVEGEEIRYEVIGGGEAEGFCGSGLIDALAVLLQLGVVDQSGRMRSAEEFQGPEWVRGRIQLQENQTIFLFTSGGRKPIPLTSLDIRALQLAKGAVQAGIRILMNEWGVGLEEIDQVFIAGAFGNKIRPESARAIGLIPPVPRERVHFLGNTAHIGAKWMLLSEKEWSEGVSLSRKVCYFELSGREDFLETFGQSLGFEKNWNFR